MAPAVRQVERPLGGRQRDAKITDITKEAGKAAGSFYRYFTDKDDLMRSLAEDFLASHRDRAHGTLGPDHRFATRDDVRSHV